MNCQSCYSQLEIALFPTVHHQFGADQTGLALLLLEAGIRGAADVTLDTEAAPDKDQAEENAQFTGHRVFSCSLVDTLNKCQVDLAFLLGKGPDKHY